MFSRTPTKVAIVRAGEWGDMRQEKGDYDFFVEMVTGVADKATIGEGQEKAAESRAVKSTEEALTWLDGSGGVIVYISRGMREEAKKTAAEHPNLRVVLFTGYLPDGEVIFVSKAWIRDRNMIEDILLRG